MDAKISKYKKKHKQNETVRYSQKHYKYYDHSTFTSAQSIDKNSIIKPQNYRTTFSIASCIQQNKEPQRSSISHIAYQPQNTDETYEQIIEQPHTISFCSQNYHLFSPRCAARLHH